MRVQLSAESLGVLLLEKALAEFGDTLGNEMHNRWHPPAQAPTLPVEAVGHKSVCTFLRNYKVNDGHNNKLKHWIPYWGSNSTACWDWSRVEPVLEQIIKAHNDVNHEDRKGDTPLDAMRIMAVVQGMELVYSELKLDTSVLQGLLAQLQHLASMKVTETALSIPVTMTAEERGGLRMPFRDPRKYLVSRGPLIASVAAHLRRQPWARVLLFGESGTGKTMAAIAAAYEVCQPLHIGMHNKLNFVCTGEGAIPNPAVHSGNLSQSEVRACQICSQSCARFASGCKTRPVSASS